VSITIWRAERDQCPFWVRSTSPNRLPVQMIAWSHARFHGSELSHVALAYCHNILHGHSSGICAVLPVTAPIPDMTHMFQIEGRVLGLLLNEYIYYQISLYSSVVSWQLTPACRGSWTKVDPSPDHEGHNHSYYFVAFVSCSAIRCFHARCIRVVSSMKRKPVVIPIMSTPFRASKAPRSRFPSLITRSP
jgi:hypothetical protein